jgi:hypothetical protein
MARRYWLLMFAALCLAVALHCGKSDSGSPTTPPVVKADPSYASDIQPIFTSSCATSASCHQSPGQQGLILSTGQSYALLVNVSSTEVPALKRVRPAKIDSSYVADKLDGTQTVGARMPLGGTLSSTSIQLIKNWIAQGAKDN